MDWPTVWDASWGTFGFVLGALLVLGVLVSGSFALPSRGGAEVDDED